MTARVRALPRRRKPSVLAKLRALWIVVAVLVAAGAYGGITLAGLPAFRPHRIVVHGDLQRVSAGAVLGAARIDRSANVWLLDTRAASQRIQAIPYVATATVRRRFPGGIDITVTERVPAHCVESGRRIVTIDAEARVLQDGCAARSLPRMRLGGAALGRPGTLAADPTLIALLRDARALADAGVAVRALAFDGFGSLTATDRAGIELRFGDDADLVQKAALVEPVREASRHGRRIRAIDLRAPATPTVEFR